MESPLKYLYTGSAPQKGEKKSLLILLHGYGSNEMDLYSFADQLPDKYFVVSVQAPVVLPWGGFAWFNLDFSGIEKIADLEQAESSRAKVIEFISYMKAQYEINHDDIKLLGFSQGAMISQAIALSKPELLSGVVALSGFVMESVISEIQAPDEKIKEVRFFIGHGNQDDVVPVDLDRKTKSYLENIGVDLTYNEYPVAHGITPEELIDIVNWLK